MAVGIALVATALMISSWDATAAGFFLIVGAPVTLPAFVTLRDLKSVSVSPASFTAEFREQVDRAEEILDQLKRVEERISYVLTEQMLNDGGHTYVGGYGEEAEFKIVGALAEVDAGEAAGRLHRNISKLKTQLGIKLIYGVIGAHSKIERAPSTIRYLISTESRTTACREGDRTGERRWNRHQSRHIRPLGL
ncbi:hypothetical protein [Ensifer sp. LCM 4579]|uniref:hypothetical protein n=1 Tax=Ensifer sp. LCM 4579 TaxID=1848292 RepID=UPI0010423F9A|nr:hypothetical protein [Ensifer sp. LCM 4579]